MALLKQHKTGVAADEAGSAGNQHAPSHLPKSLDADDSEAGRRFEVLRVQASHPAALPCVSTSHDEALVLENVEALMVLFAEEKFAVLKTLVSRAYFRTDRETCVLSSDKFLELCVFFRRLTSHGVGDQMILFNIIEKANNSLAQILDYLFGLYLSGRAFFRGLAARAGQ